MRFYAETPILWLDMGGKLEKVERLVAALRAVPASNAGAINKVEGHSPSMRDNRQRKG